MLVSMNVRTLAVAGFTSTLLVGGAGACGAQDEIETHSVSAGAAIVQIPSRSASLTADGTAESAAAAPAKAKAAAGAATAQPASGIVYYQNCDTVRAAGADAIRVGDPGFSHRLDRDGDGVGCEK